MTLTPEQRKRRYEKYFRAQNPRSNVVRSGTDHPHTSGRKRGTPSGVGSVTTDAIREALGTFKCGNCTTGTYSLMYHEGCDQLLCAGCRKKMRESLAGLSVMAQVDRALGLTYTVTSGTFIPDDIDLA